MACAYHFWIQITIGVTSCINIDKSSFFFFLFLGGGGDGVGSTYLLYIFLIELPDL